MARFVRATRVQLVCPSGNGDLYRATNAIISRLLAEETIRAWGGLTYSSIDPPMFTGQFWNNGRAGQWEEDQNVLIVLDAPGRSRPELLAYLAELREVIAGVYEAVGEPQKSLWITAHSLSVLQD